MFPILLLVLCVIFAFLLYQLAYVPSALVRWAARFALGVFLAAGLVFVIVTGRLPPLYNLLYLVGPCILISTIIATGAGTQNSPVNKLDKRTKEAYDVLGLQPRATKKEINQAHRRLLAKIHPDQGGSSYLAAKINEARDILLKEASK